MEQVLLKLKELNILDNIKHYEVLFISLGIKYERFNRSF